MPATLNRIFENNFEEFNKFDDLSWKTTIENLNDKIQNIIKIYNETKNELETCKKNYIEIDTIHSKLVNLHSKLFKNYNKLKQNFEKQNIELSNTKSRLNVLQKICNDIQKMNTKMSNSINSKIEIKHIYVCHFCFMKFYTEKKIKNHLISIHDD